MSESTPHAHGTLYVVATPIGALDDLSPRARDVLQAVALVCAEDTRHTAQLAQLVGLRLPPTWSLHDHNERDRVPAVLERLLAGDDVALVSDAGTPTVSDPGYLLVERAAAEGITVSPVPGPCAAIAALCASGLPPLPFVLLGFPPAKGDADAWFRSHIPTRTTCALYVPGRDLPRHLEQLAQRWPTARVVVARELTKLHETFYRGLARDVTVPADQARGEAVLLIWRDAEQATADDEALVADVERLLAKGLSHRDAVSAVAELRGAPRKHVQKLAHHQKPVA